MGFVKGMVAGMMLGVAINAINNGDLKHFLSKGKNEMRRFRRKLTI